MISYLNLAETAIKGFNQVNELSIIIPEGLTAVYTDQPLRNNLDHENILLISLDKEYRLSPPTGGKLWKMSVTETMFDQLTALVQMFYEHTFLPYQESKMLYSEAQQFRSFFDIVPAAMYVKDTESRFILVNDRFKKHVGLAPDFDVTGKTDFDIFDEQHASQAFADEKEIMESGEPKAAYEEFERLPDGSEYWALSTKIPIRDINGRVIGVSGVSFDITKFKRSE